MDSSQIEREHRIYREGRELLLEKLMKAEEAGKMTDLPYTNYLIRQVVDELVQDIKRDSRPPKKTKGAGAPATAFKKFALYLGSLDPALAALRGLTAALHTVLTTGGADVPVPAWKMTAAKVGKAVYFEYLAQHFKQVNPAMFNSLLREYSRSMTSNEAHLVTAFKAKMTKEGLEYPVWAFGDLEGVGSYLLTQMVRHRLFESWTRTEVANGKARVVKYLALSEELRDASVQIMQVCAEVVRANGALIEAPMDWDHTTNGGGGMHTPDMKRALPYAVQGNGPVKVAESTVLTLNLLQRREWQINRPVLAIVHEAAALRNFGDVVAPYTVAKPEWREDFTDRAKAQWKAAAREWYTQKKIRKVQAMNSQRTLEEAHDLAQYPTIWFAYYADFRGRKYAVSKGVSPQGNDLEKGLISLKQGKPVKSDSAQRWFRIHGANKWGLDKLTLEDRERWVLDNHIMLRDMGRSPLDHREWMDCDCPVQFLAWVMEYAAWVDNPATFQSHLALGQDGTCNGLQNFSALLRDEVGGAAVNLVPSETPRDIYKDVADFVMKILPDMPQSLERDLWIAHAVNRKVTKRTTMTLPYGCTRYACSTFVREYVEAVKPPEFPLELYGDLANYLSHLIWKALDGTVVKAREVMRWLQEWAQYTARLNKRPAWVTPSGLLVRNYYEREISKEVRSAAFNTRIRLSRPTGQADARKIANAVAPNFVHSLDAAHLDRVVQRACSEGMDPVTIHDDFGVHAEDTERFHQIIREEFVDMYDGLDILEVMREKVGFPTPPPNPGTLDLQRIKDSKYFFA